MIRSAFVDDAPAIVEIYNYYIEHTVITFEQKAVAIGEMAQRITNVQALGLPWLVALEADIVVGYAYATQWKQRSAYQHSVEVTVYLAPAHHTKGIGTQLYRALMQTLEQLNVHAVIGGITLPNNASVALHEKFGMKQVAHFEQVGYKFEQWLDVGYWQKVLPIKSLASSNELTSDLDTK